MSNYLNETGLAYLWLKIKATFIKKSDTTAVTSISIDSTPTASSNNLVTSGGVKTALDSKLNTIDSSHKLSADLISDGTTNKAYTATEKTKLSGIASGAEVNVQANWNETNTSSDAYILNKPSIPDDSNLVHKTGDEYIHGTKSFQSDTGHYISIDSNIEKVFSEAPLNYWDWIKITGKGGLNQTLQQALNARDNVQADWNLTTTTAADYIKNKPTIPAAQIQSDWNQTTTTALDYIKNKPTIPAAQIQADWNQTVTTAADYIKNKPSIFKDGIKLIISNPGFIDIHNDDQNIEITAFDDDIKLNAGGKAYYNNNEIATKNDIPTVSTTVTQNDTNPVSGGAVYTKFADLIGSAPAALDTLQEIAAALNNDANLASTLTTQINAKVPKVSNPTTNNFASFNSDGTIKDSGVSASSFITTETQPDWNETTTTSAAYIQNKPNIICYDGYNPNNSISFGPNGIGIDVLGTSNELNLYAPVVCINDFTINDNSEILNSNGENVVLKILNAYSEEYKRILMIEDESEIDDNTLANDIYKVIFYDLELDEISEEYTEKITIGILVHTDNVQYLIKDGVAKYRIYENNNWSEWQNTVKDTLSSEYEMSSDSNDDLFLAVGDTYEEAFAKLEKEIIDNELITATALTDLNERVDGKVDKVSNATSGNFASLDANGNLVDSGHKHSDYSVVTFRQWL